MTCAWRRLVFLGLATTIGWSVNMRELRWVLENRTTPAAEEEIRFVFDKVGELVIPRYPNLFQDFSSVNDAGEPWDEERDSYPYCWRPRYSKV